ncbi:hypothetical protein [Alienimonas sp. DA493]|uniref:hypothetical protein n=1 Tax=Alienimonas sp. DA493 TaxID=3373605 RepID=UPI0037552794
MKTLPLAARINSWTFARVGVRVACFAALWCGHAVALDAAELLVGAARTTITPDEPVALSGQFHTRVAKTVESPCTANVLVLESRDGDKSLETAVMVSCDLVVIREDVQSRIRSAVAAKAPEVETQKLFVNATHTHTAPVMVEGKYVLPADGVVQPAEYVEFLVGQVSDAVVEAWNGRQPAGVSWGLGQAVVARNRRAVYADGSAKMYGRTDKPEFRGIEGFEDHDVDVLTFWDADKKPLAMAVDVACPSQEVEGRTAVNADFWHPTRDLLRKRYGQQLEVVGWCGAAGDQSPHLMYNRAAEARMLTLRGLTRLEEIARRLDAAVAEANSAARNDIRTDVPMKHLVRTLKLPIWRVTEEQNAAAQAEVDRLSKDPADRRKMNWHKTVTDRYKQQQEGDLYERQFHVVRLGDIAICTNPFELYTDYGVQIKARSKAVQTFVIQLVGEESGTYLPTVRAVGGGGYSAIPQSCPVGPEGGQALVDQTVEAINSLWDE